METLKKFNIKSPSHLLGLFLVLFILLAIPLTVIQTLNSRDDRPKADTVPNETIYEIYQWAPQKINAPKAWDITTGSSTVKIAVVSTGVLSTHEDLAANMITGANVVDGTTDTRDDFPTGGTYQAGIIGAVGNNNRVGMAGINWSVQLLPVKFCEQSCDYTKLPQAIRRAAELGAKVIYVGLWTDVSTPDLQAAVAYVQAAPYNAIIVAPAGHNAGLVSFPAAYNGVVAVSLTDQNDAVPSYAGRGPELDLVAPGINTTSTSPYGGYQYKSGSDMAAAHVAGVFGLLLAKSVPPQTAITAVTTGVKDLGIVGRDDIYGNGRLDACGAFQKASQLLSRPDLACPVGSGGDTITPSIVSGVRAISGADGNPGVQVLWDPATDNVAVLGYHVYLNGSTTPLNTTPQSGNSFTHNTTNFTGTYTVKAKDTSQNLSISFSSPAATVVACTKVDVDDTLAIDLTDTLAILAHFGESPSIPANYNPTYDIDTNPGIDLADALYSLKFFGKGCS